MITESGRQILSKYLIGQVPGYASYIAIGCGPKPKASSYEFTNDDVNEYYKKSALDFEMLRVPIISRGYVTGASGNEIVFTAELPTDERYAISEVGVFSAAANSSAGAYDSRVVFSFNSSENWEYHSSAGAFQPPYISASLSPENDGIIDDLGNVVFSADSNNPLFENTTRINRGEPSRFLNRMLLVRGDMSEISNELEPGPGSGHIHLTGQSFNFDQNSANDLLKLAFSVVSKTDQPDDPHKVKIVVEFSSDDTSSQDRQYAWLSQTYDSSDFASTRYHVLSKSLEDISKSANFSWGSVSVVKIYVLVEDINGQPDSDFYVAIDAIRFDNINTYNPAYGMTGYSVIKTADSNPVIKSANSSNMIEFRFAMDVV